VTAGRGGAAAVDPNRTALRLEGGAITYPGRALVAHSETFTVQFFAKMKEIRAGAGLARVNRGSETALSSAVTWALSFADADGNLSLKVDTDKAAGQVRTFAAALSPGVWHHLALQFAVEDGHSVISLYRDYALVGTWTATGTILARPRLMNFMLGAGEDPAAGFDGWIDELRVTPGLVPVEEFLFPKNRGLIFWMR
jgi:hypothetical protein